jgi:cytochrome c/predicted membrane protein DUF2231
MASRPRSIFFALAALAVLALCIAVLFFPPAGQQQGDFAQFVGTFHLLVIHFPIALLILALLFEIITISKKNASLHLRHSTEFILALAVLGVIVSAWLGWLLAWSGGYQGELVKYHMWGGATLAVASVGCLWSYGSDRKIGLALLIGSVGLMSWTGHEGGKLTHGSGYLTDRMPAPLRGWLGVSAGKVDIGVDPSSFYAIRVHPILADRCISCHGADKQKGGLRLDSYQNVMHGGKDGKIIQPGDAKNSELFRRITLPPDSKKFMPAEGKPALTADETKVLELWIGAGAPVNVNEKSLAGLPALHRPEAPQPKVADYRPQLQTIISLETSLNIKLIPRSQDPTDGLILRTVGSPQSCTDQTLAKLAPISNFIVDTELTRTKITDAGLATLASSYPNLRFVDLSYTDVTVAGIKQLAHLNKLESLNLTATKVHDNEVADLRARPNLKLYLFETR